jgi:DNA primase
MDPNDNAKYLNSPETELFDKGRSLYNIGPARAAAGRGQPFLVAEGYMDVIALAEAGFEAAVAPLGTAVTEPQLQMMWRVADEPIIALDGDTAGLRAAMRVIDLALPLLEAGKSLRFAVMPEGKDPDDLIRAEGPAAVQAVLDQAMPMVRLLWQRETEGKVFDSPERKAILDKALREKIALIRDPSIRKHYGDDIKEMRWDLFRQGRRPARSKGQFSGGGARSGRGNWRGQQPAVPRSTTKSSALVAQGEAATISMREAVVLASALCTPEVIVEFESRLEAMPCQDPDHALMRDMLLRHGIDAPEHLREQIEQSLGPQALENLFALRHVAISPCLRKPGDMEIARLTLSEEFAKLEARYGLNSEIAEATEDLSSLADETLTWRVGQAAEARNRAVRSENEDRAQYDIADNGARMNREERDELDRIMSTINFAKKRR